MSLTESLERDPSARPQATPVPRLRSETSARAAALLERGSLGALIDALNDAARESILRPKSIEVARTVQQEVPALYASLSTILDLSGNGNGERLTRELATVYDLLTTLVRQAYVAVDEVVDDERTDAVVTKFLEQLHNIRRMLNADLQAAYDGDPALKPGRLLDVLSYPGLRAITSHRLAHALHTLNVPLIPRYLSEHTKEATGIDIHPGAHIGHSFFIDHGTGVVIGETTVIGNNVKLYQGVTLGALSFPRDATGALIRDKKRHPTLEDRVVVYASATILGGDTVIGHDSIIGADVCIKASVSPNTVVTQKEPELTLRSRK